MVLGGNGTRSFAENHGDAQRKAEEKFVTFFAGEE